MDAEALVHGPVPTDRLDHFLPDIIDRVVLPLGILSISYDQFLRLRARPFAPVYQIQIAHSREDVVARLARRCPIGPRRQSVGALNQTSQGRTFRQREVPSMFAKITARCRFRSVETAPEVDPVQVQLHDFLFAELLLDPASQKNLEQFAMKRAFLERKTVPGQLLGDRTCPLADMTGRDVLQRCPCDSKQIVTAMLIKLPIPPRDHRIDQAARQLLIGHRLAVEDAKFYQHGGYDL